MCDTLYNVVVHTLKWPFFFCKSAIVVNIYSADEYVDYVIMDVCLVQS